MSRVALIAPFLCSARPDLSALLSGDPYAVRDALAEDFGEWSCEPGQESAHASLIDDHESLGASLLPGRLLTGRRQVPQVASDVGVTALTVSVGLHGVASLVMWLELDDLDLLEDAESSLCSLVPRLAAEIRDHLLGSDALTTSVRIVDVRYPQDAFLYWHRVLCAPAAQEVWAHRLSGDVAVPLGNGSVAHVGDGYTTVCDASADVVDDVVRGLLRAQELWLTTTTVSQSLLLEIGLLTRAGGSTADLAATQRQAVALADREALREGVVQDEIAFATGVQRSVLDGAAASWGLELDNAGVRRRLEVLLRMIERRVTEHQARQQDRLNAIVLALTAVGALALVLGLFETGVGESVGDLDLARLLISGAVGLLALTSIVLALRRGGRSSSPPS